MLPSGPAVMFCAEEMVTGACSSLIVPWGVILPITFRVYSTNQRFPSGPVAIPCGKLPRTGSGNRFDIVPALAGADTFESSTTTATSPRIRPVRERDTHHLPLLGRRWFILDHAGSGRQTRAARRLSDRSRLRASKGAQLGTFFWRVFVTMFVIIDPVGGVPVFLTLTRGRTHRGRLALQAVVAAFVLVLAFGLFGQQILRYLGISIPSLQ